MARKTRAPIATNLVPPHLVVFEGEHWRSLFREDDLRDFHSNNSMALHAPCKDEGVVVFVGSNKVCFHLETLNAGWRLPIPIAIRAIPAHLHLTLLRFCGIRGFS